jgi:lysophospholipase L1-like esterase
VAEEAARLKAGAERRFRVAFLGDSSTYGTCEETQDTFVGVANRLLPHVAAVNLGVNGYTSYQGYKALLKYGDVVKPDLIFISFSFNDRRFVLAPEQKDGPATFRRLHTSNLIQGFSEVSYLFRAANWVSRMIAPAPAPATATGATREVGDGSNIEVSLEGVRPRVSLEDYRENLARMVQWARQRGVTVVFLALADNPTTSAATREGVKLLAEGKLDAAIKRLDAVKGNDEERWFSAIARLHLAKAYERKGDRDRAKAALVLDNAFSGVTGGFPVVLDTDYLAVMREVAVKHGIAVVDAAGELSKVPEVYWDFCHFNEDGHEIVGRLVAEAIEAARAKRTAGKG